MDTVPEDAVVKLRHGSFLNEDDLRQLHEEMQEVFAERDRARELAAKLEEVVAMRTAVLKALVEWRDSDRLEARPQHPGPSLGAIIDWAAAQLSEVP